MRQGALELWTCALPSLEHWTSLESPRLGNGNSPLIEGPIKEGPQAYSVRRHAPVSTLDGVSLLFSFRLSLQRLDFFFSAIIFDSFIHSEYEVWAHHGRLGIDRWIGLVFQDHGRPASLRLQIRMSRAVWDGRTARYPNLLRVSPG